MAVMRTHNATGYRRGCRCPLCTEDQVRRVREWRARNRRACGICRRVHPGRCVPDDVRSVAATITLPGWVARRLHALVPWGERSRWIAELVERELERLAAQESAA